jgi:tRNA(Ile)-lysidine synthase
LKRLLNELHRADRAHSFFPPNSSVLIALSGGPDSVCLALLLGALRASRRLRIAAAHVHHGLRAGAARDEAWVRKFCEDRRIPFYSARVSVRGRAAARSESLEEAARRARYAALLRIARARGFASVATGHTADDQAETVLMRLAGGSGLWGLAGIPAVRNEGSVRIIRPLLKISKRDILAALRRAGEAYRTDPSNRSERFLRNRLRRQMLPLMRKRLNPRLDEHLAELAEDAGRWRLWAGAEASAFVRRHGRRRGRLLSFAAAPFGRLPEPLRAPVFIRIMETLSGKEQHLRREHIRQIEELLASPAQGERRLAMGGRVRKTGRGSSCRIVWTA